MHFGLLFASQGKSLGEESGISDEKDCDERNKEDEVMKKKCLDSLLLSIESS